MAILGDHAGQCLFKAVLFGTDGLFNPNPSKNGAVFLPFKLSNAVSMLPIRALSSLALSRVFY